MHIFQLSGVFGDLDLHGIPRNVYWTKLTATVEAGERVLQLKDSVDWKVQARSYLDSCMPMQLLLSD